MSQFLLVTVRFVAAVIVLMLPTRSEADFYRWADDDGSVHFSNVPSEVPPGRETTRVRTRESARPSGTSRGQVEMDGDVEAGEDLEAGEVGEAHVSTGSGVARERSRRSTSPGEVLARSELRRELADAKAELAELDGKLADLAKVRTQWARQGNPMVGDLRATGAADVRSPEEEVLEEKRKGLAKEIEEIEARIAKLPAR